MQECITHTHVIQLPELPAQKTLIDVSNCTSSLACVLAEITNTQTSYVYDLLTEIYAIIPQMDLTPPPAERRGHGFLSFIGRALNFIGTGLVDEQQLNEAVGKIQKATELNVQALKTFQKQQDSLSTYMRVANSRFDTLQRIVDRQQTVISSIESQFQETVSEFDREIRMEAALLKRLTTFVIETNQILELRSAMLSLKQGVLTADLITIDQMSHILDQIKQHVAPFNYPLLDTIELMYRHSKFTVQRNFSQIFIHAQVPLGQPYLRARHLTLYEITIVPLPFEEHSIEIDLDVKYIAWSQFTNYFIEFQELPQLSEAGIYRMTLNKELPRNVRYVTCALALINQVGPLIKQLCKTRVVFDHRPPRLIAFSNTQALLLSVNYYMSICPSNQNSSDPEQAIVANHSGCASCIVDISCGCYIETEVGVHFGRPSACQNFEFEDMSVNHLVNLNLLHAFFDPDTLSKFQADLLLSKPVNLKLPEFKQFQSDYTRDIAQMSRQSMLLTDIANRTKQQSMIFRTLSEKLAYELQTSQMRVTASGLSFNNYQAWLLMFSVLGIIILGIVAVRFHLQIRTLYTGLLIAQQAKGASAVSDYGSPDSDIELNWFNIFSTLPPPSVNHFQAVLPDVQHSGNSLQIISLLTFVLFWLYIIRRVYLAKHRSNSFTIFLELGNISQHIVVPLMNIRHNPMHYVFRATTFNPSLLVHGMLTLEIIWMDFKIQHLITDTEFLLPRTVTLNPYLIHQLRQIFVGDYYMLLWTKQNDSSNFVLLPLENSQWSKFKNARSRAALLPDPLQVISLYPALLPPPM